MDEYIKRKDAFEILQARLDGISQMSYLNMDWHELDIMRDAIENAIDDIGEVPIADVQPVVHCKDCKHRKEHHYEEIGEKPYIKYECKFTKYSMSDDGFCSFGARMGGDAE